MKVIHRISLNAKQEAVADFAAAGVRLGTGFASFDIGESDPRWRVVCSLITKHDALDIVRSEWNEREIANARALWMEPAWHHGYPLPDGDMGYKRTTYDSTDPDSRYCALCGIGLRQVAPFRMTREPRWGTRSILQLNWVFDEYFVTPSLWRSVFEPLGIGSRAVLNSNGTRQLASVLQLDVPARVPVAGLERPAPCPSCHRFKHAAIKLGPFPRADLGGHHVVKTEEWFGSGASGWRAIIISGELYRRLRDEKAKGVVFTPVADAAATTAPISSSSR